MSFSWYTNHKPRRKKKQETTDNAKSIPSRSATLYSLCSLPLKFENNDTRTSHHKNKPLLGEIETVKDAVNLKKNKVSRMAGIRKTKSRPTTPLRQSEPPRTPSTVRGGEASNHELYSRTGKSSKKFNPKLIFSQIAAFQSLHYFILSILFQLNSFLFSSPVSLDRIFTAKHLSVWTSEGRLDAITIIVSSLIGSFLLAIIVEKSKKCLDFSITLFFLHCIICGFGFGPEVFSSADFWIVHLLGLILMVVLGEYLCSRRELMEIPLL